MNNYPPSPYPGQNPSSQPGFPPTQPAFSQPEPGFLGGSFQTDYVQLPRKKHTILWIGLIILLLLAIGAGSYYYFVSRSTPQKTLQAYCTALKNNDAQGYYNTLATEQQVQTSVSKLQQGLRLLTFLTGGLKDCVIDDNSIQENDPVATATVMFVPKRGPTIHTTIRLIDENGQWRIAKNTNLP